MKDEVYERFVTLVREMNTLRAVQQLLEWDQETCMPPAGVEDRARQLGLLVGLAHERLTTDELGRLLEQLESRENEDSDVRANLRAVRRDYDRAVKLPRELVEEVATVASQAKSAWSRARAEKKFDIFAPWLERMFELKRREAECVGFEDEAYDALLDEFEPGARAAEIDVVFSEVRKRLVSLVEQIRSAPRRPDKSVLSRPCPIERQERFNRRIMEAMGFDFEAGTLSVSRHPFCCGITPRDVRITTRYEERYLPTSLFGTMHEAGHALYEQGLPAEHVGTPLGQSVSLGVHESQSRMWENQVGRSREFWEHFLEPLKEAFPALADVTLDQWHFAVNNVEPSPIRVEADEVTYCLHIFLRFDIERRLLSGRLAVSDVPDAWNASMEELLGLTPADDAEGCLQDIHWAMGIIGYFPTYALGNLYAAQLYEAARRDLGDWGERLAAGDLRPLREWLREHVHRHGRRFLPGELLERVTGRQPTAEAYTSYLENKYLPLYGLA